MNRVLIVPAAGRGSRLGSELPKFLVPVNGRPMIEHVLDVHLPHVSSVVLVVAPSAVEVAEQLARRYTCPVIVAVQAIPTGMLDAILAPAGATPVLDTADEVWITWCDQVAVLAPTLERVRRALDGSPRLVVPTVVKDEPYIHFERDAEGRIIRVLQRREGLPMPARGEGDLGLFAMTGETYRDDLRHFSADVDVQVGQGTGERNFLPFVPWLAARAEVVTVPATDPIEAIGINTPDDLRFVERHLRGALP